MSSLTYPSSPESRVTIAGSTSRFGRTVCRMRNGSKSTVTRSGEERAADDELLDLRRALVDAEGTDLAIEALDDGAVRHAEASEELHGAVDDALRGLGREHLRH